ncbi:MAG: hypothetical protein Fur0037_03520 [Planctomycetota bacterium]
MTEKRRTEKGAGEGTFCRRLQRMLPVAEHERCPYCFGKAAEVEQGCYDKFCDFKPGQDPINYGFPPDTSRNRES